MLHFGSNQLILTKFDGQIHSNSKWGTKFDLKFEFQIRQFRSNSELFKVKFEICPSLMNAIQVIRDIFLASICDILHSKITVLCFLKTLKQWFSTGVPRNPWVPWKTLGVPPISKFD